MPLPQASRFTFAFCLLGAATLGNAGDFSTAISGPFTYGFLAAGLALPLLRDGAQAQRHSLRTLDALASSFLLTEGLKASVRERRPDGTDRGSFPSEHASLAFTVATTGARFHPREAPYWYLGAALIGESRVEERKHYVHDVLAGAALGYGTTMLELALPHGLILQPLIGAHGQKGLAMGGRL